MSTASLTTQSHQVSRKLWVFLQQKLDQMQYRMSLVQYYTQVIKEIPKIPKDCRGCSSDSKSERGERIEKSRLANKFPLGYQPKSNCFEIQAQRRVNLSHFHQQLLLGHTKTEEGAQGSEIIIVRLSLASRHGIQSQYSVFFLPFYFTVGKTRRDVLLCLIPVISFCISTSCSHPFSGYSVSLLSARRRRGN